MTVHDVGEHEDQVYVAMEYVDGVTLRHWLRTEHSQQELAGLSEAIERLRKRVLDSQYRDADALVELAQVVALQQSEDIHANGGDR